MKKSKSELKKYKIGIDEVGRGPIAGPVVVCACAVAINLRQSRESRNDYAESSADSDVLSLFPKGVLKDSKKLSEKKRNEIVKNVESYVDDEKIVYGIGEVDARTIDEIGITASINEAIKNALEKVHKLGVDEKSKIFLDGSLHADGKYIQETILKGDEKIPEIALASIIAKVYRDNLMKKIALEFPNYGFENHVGYGTRAHYSAIYTYGITSQHRKSYLKNIVIK